MLGTKPSCCESKCSNCCESKKKCVTMACCGSTTGTGIGLLIYFLLFSSTSVNTNYSMFAGANHYYLYSCSETYQRQTFSLMNQYNLNVLRVFLLSTDGMGYPGEADCDFLQDVENPVGTYQQDTINRINKMFAIGKEYNIKFIVSLHDRWSLGCWRRDAYVTKYNIPYEAQPSQCTQLTVNNPNNPSQFYNDVNIRNDFKNRLQYLMNVNNPWLNKTWANMDDVIFAWEPQNEPQRGTSTPQNDDWICEMSAWLKRFTKIPIGSGGGWESIYIPLVDHVSKVLNCGTVDILTIHDYNGKAIANLMLSANAGKAMAYGKRVILAEFGSSSSTDIIDHINLAEDKGIPWMFWSIDKAGKELSFGTPSNPMLSSVIGPRSKKINTSKTWQLF